MLDLNHTLRSGKYAGKTVGTVYNRDRRYFNWVVENRPEMLKSHKSKTQPMPHAKSNAIKPNYDFAPDKPAPYLASTEEAFGMNFPSEENND